MLPKVFFRYVDRMGNEILNPFNFLSSSQEYLATILSVRFVETEGEGEPNVTVITLRLRV